MDVTNSNQESLHTMLKNTQNPPECVSEVYYFEMLNDNPSTLPGLRKFSENLKTYFAEKYQLSKVVVVCDGKIFSLLCTLRKEQKFNFIIPQLGDFHLNLAYFRVIFKKYGEYFLMSSAQALNFSERKLRKIFSCSHYRLVLDFLYLVYESLMIYLVRMFKQYYQLNHQNGPLPQFMLKIHEVDWEAPDALETYFEELKDFNEDFQRFIGKLCAKSENWKFLYQFLFEDMAALQLLLDAIQNGSHKQRMSAIKLMTPLFFAFNSTNYNS